MVLDNQPTAVATEFPDSSQNISPAQRRPAIQTLYSAKRTSLLLTIFQK